MRTRLCPAIPLLLIIFISFSCSSGSDDDGKTTGRDDLPAGAERAVQVTPGSPLISYHGRVDRSNPEQPVFDWPASGFSICFRGTGIVLELLDSGKNDFTLFLDGKREKRAVLQPGENRIVFSGLVAGTKHRIDCYKSTEGDQGMTALTGITPGEGVELLPAEPARYRITVFGDSVSAGYGAAAESAGRGWKRGHADATLSWAFLAAREADAELNLIAASGRGLVRNYGEPGPVSDSPLPVLAWRQLMNGSSVNPGPEEGDTFFSEPDLVIICLGHNDISPGYSLSRQQFTGSYLEFLADIRSRWTSVPILCGSVDIEPLTSWIDSAVTAARDAGDSGVSRYSFAPPGDGERGDDFHPNYRAQERFAREILPLIRDVPEIPDTAAVD